MSKFKQDADLNLAGTKLRLFLQKQSSYKCVLKLFRCIRFREGLIYLYHGNNKIVRLSHCVSELGSI